MGSASHGGRRRYRARLAVPRSYGVMGLAARRPISSPRLTASKLRRSTYLAQIRVVARSIGRDPRGRGDITRLEAAAGVPGFQPMRESTAEPGIGSRRMAEVIAPTAAEVLAATKLAVTALRRGMGPCHALVR